MEKIHKYTFTSFVLNTRKQDDKTLNAMLKINLLWLLFIYIELVCEEIFGWDVQCQFLLRLSLVKGLKTKLN